MARRGRPNKYFTHIQPRLTEIAEMCLTMTEKQISTALGVGYSSWCDYKLKYPELSDAIKRGRGNLVVELKSALIQKAKGFSYTEKKKTIRQAGEQKIIVIEEYEKYAQPDTGAIHLLLKNLDVDWRNDDQATMDLKKKQVELTERRIENDNW